MKTRWNYNFAPAALTGLLVGVLMVSAHAQAPSQNGAAAFAVVNGAVVDRSADSTDGAPTVPPAASDALSTAPEGNWQIDATGYLWLPGLHGNLNAFDQNVGFKASLSDLLKRLDFGVMGLVGVRYKELVTTSDLLFIALSVNNTKVFELPGSPQLTSEVKGRVVIFTEKVGYRILNEKTIQADFLGGFRFWHLGTTLTLTPSPFASNPYASRNWVDPVVGGRILIPLSPKLVATVAGDVGGWGAGSQLDYQVVGALGYKLSPKMALQAAWRYLYLDYSSRAQFSSQLAMSGLVLGATYTLK